MLSYLPLIGIALVASSYMLAAGHGRYLLDVVIVLLCLALIPHVAAPGWLLLPSAALIGGRHWPWGRPIGLAAWLARAIVPGAYPKTPDTQPATAADMVPTWPRVMSRVAERAARTFAQQRRGRRITRGQERLRVLRHQNAGNSVPYQEQQNGTELRGNDVTIREAEQIAAWLAQGQAEGWIVKHLDGYSGRKYQAYLAKVRAVKMAIAARESEAQ